MSHVGFYAAFRYRLSRIHLRGIRFGLVGSSVGYGLLGTRVLVLSFLTLGLYWPFGFAALVKRFVDSMEYGTQRFTFRGNGKEIFWSYFFCWVLFLPTLGLSFLWFAPRDPFHGRATDCYRRAGLCRVGTSAAKPHTHG